MTFASTQKLSPYPFKGSLKARTRPAYVEGELSEYLRLVKNRYLPSGERT